MAALDGMSAEADISIVVPVLRDPDALARLIASIDTWTRRPRELMVVDGAAEEPVRVLCERTGCLYRESEANRGAQMDLGARQAHGAMLWFVHADADPSPRALEAIMAARESGYESGCFRFRFQGRSNPMKGLIEQLVRLRVAAGGTPYSDQGLFCSRRVYDAVGGFEHLPLFEEARFVQRLRARRTFTALPEAIGVATHRWEEDGYLRRSLHNRWLAVRHGLGVAPHSLSAAYRSGKSPRRKARR